MTTILPPLRLTGALALRDGRLDRRSVALADGRFTTGPLPAVDLTGYLLLPGIVDLHAALPVPARRTRPASPGSTRSPPAMA